MVRTCKIPTMKIYSFLYSLSFYSFLIASEVNVEDILIKAFHRLDNTNYNFIAEKLSSIKGMKSIAIFLKNELTQLI